MLVVPTSYSHTLNTLKQKTGWTRSTPTKYVHSSSSLMMLVRIISVLFFNQIYFDKKLYNNYPCMFQHINNASSTNTDRLSTSVVDTKQKNSESSPCFSPSSVLPPVHSNQTSIHNNHINNNNTSQQTRSPLIQQQQLSTSSMDESIDIRPEFQRMEITNGGQITGAVAHPMRREFSAARTSSAGDQQPTTSNRWIDKQQYIDNICS